MTGISDEFIAEAALVAPVGVAAPRKKPFASLSRALNSGWGVACICFIVAIAAVVGMVAWGRMGDMTGPGSDPAVRFAFSYEMTDNNGSAWSGTAMPGDMVNVRTTIVNHGKPFKSYGFRAHAQFVLQEDDSIIIEGVYPLIDAPKETIETNRVGTCFFSFQIPANATPGVYDLVLSYDGEKQVFGGALTVGDPNAKFSFGYKSTGDALTGATYLMNTWITNEGEPFTFEGSSMGFAPTAVLIHMETQYRIDGSFGVDDDHGVFTVDSGDVGRVTQEFFIPDDAPTGAYALQLSYRGVFKSFAGVVIVAVPTVEQPAILYNLTMPIGSDWLYEPIDEAYVDGEEVTVRIKFATDVGTLFFLNGEVIDAVTGDDQLGYWEYSFIMPQKDSEIIFHTYDGTAPYSGMLKDYILEHPRIERADLQYYYGEYGDGAMVALLGGGVYGQLETETIVGGYSFWTHEVIPIMVWQDGIFCELPEAYEQGIITDEHLADIFALHKTGFRSYYDDD